MSNSEKTVERVMVVGAHPDDPEFGCAGTVARWAREGREITYVLLTSGDKGGLDAGARSGQMAGIREEEQRAAAHELGVERVLFLRYPDGLLENTMELRRRLCGLYREHRPHILMTIDPYRRYQLHPDHRAAGQAALDAVYAAREWRIFPEQLVGDAEPWRIHDIYLFWTDMPDHWEDVSESIEARVAALARHASQFGEDAEARTGRVREWTRETGKEVGYAHAEAFKCIRIR